VVSRTTSASTDFVDGLYRPIPFQVGIAFQVNGPVGRALSESPAQGSVEIIPGHWAVVDIQAWLRGVGEFDADEEGLEAGTVVESDIRGYKMNAETDRGRR
jgi:hypothetical protein